ncbi:hypothetical protein DRN72_01950 [Methanosarcinales archaeon]|nr:MAG: hypothetical protein DRN72_01950 [Methanosarcinales archaeon]
MLIASLLRKYGVYISSKDQCFLNDSKILNWMVDYVELNEDEVVLEIGAGLGTLTRLLCERAGKVYAIEKDPRLF